MNGLSSCTENLFNARRKAHDKLKVVRYGNYFTLLKSHLQRQNLNCLDRDANREDDVRKRL